MNKGRTQSREFTGRHMLAIMLAFFGVIISVNVLMATLAGSSWTGLVVENTYVASQQFNGKAEIGRAQAALGWRGTLSVDGGKIHYRLVDSHGADVVLKSASIAFRHPAYEAKDVSLDLRPAGDGLYAADTVPADGIWIADVGADAGLAHPWRDVKRIVITGGALE